MAFEFIQMLMKEREQQGLLRTNRVFTQQHDGIATVEGEHKINFASNDYLGLSQHPDVVQSYAEGLALYGASSSSSPAICGYYEEHQQLERKLAQLTQHQDAMIFSSGYAANHAICQALTHAQANKSLDTVLLADKLMHASFIDAAKAHCPRFSRFKHNDLIHAERKLEKFTDKSVLIASEGVFSMDGDCADIDALLRLKARHPNVWLMLDQAHAIGVMGEQGCGIERVEDYQKFNLVMGTFGKALGTHGAFVAADKTVIDFMRNFAKHYVYSTSLSPAICRASSTALDIMQNSEVVQALRNNIESFKHLISQSPLSVLPSESAVQSILIPGNETLMACAKQLLKLGILTGAVRSPTVPAGTERLRITLSALHQPEDLQALVDSLTMVTESLSLPERKSLNDDISKEAE